MYAKVFTSIWDGSLYGKLEGSAVMMACVTLCNAQGILDMTPEAISGRTGWPVDFVREGIRQLEQPDPRSRTPDQDGRRLLRLDSHRDWGWLIVNYQKYRGMKDLDTVREQTKARVQKLRDKKRSEANGNGSVTDVTLGNAQKRQAEAEAEEGKNPPTPPAGGVHRVFEHWKAQWGHPGAKLDPKRRKRIEARLKSFSPDELCEAISGFRNSPWHCGTDPKGNGTVYDALQTLLRDSEQVEKGIALNRQLNGSIPREERPDRFRTA